MKLTVERSILLEKITQLNSIVDRKQTIPVLANILIHAEKETGEVTLSATNLEIGMRTTIQDAEIAETGVATIPAQKLFEILREAPDGPITLEVGEDYWWTITLLNGGTYRLAGLSQMDFPDVPQLQGLPSISLDSTMLAEALSCTLYAVSHDESRYALTGLLLEILPNMINFVATDGHRLATSRFAIEITEAICGEVVVPWKAMVEVKKLCSASEHIGVVFQENAIVFVSNGTHLFSRLIDAQFPDYRQVIPANITSQAVFEKAMLRAAIRRVLLLSGDSHRIGCAFSPDQVVLFGEAENGEASETVPCQRNGNELKIGFNGRYLLDILSVIPAAEVRLGLTDAMSPGLWTCDSEMRHVVMPVRL